MEFHVKNAFIKKFLSQYPKQSELKLLKHLTILGIHFLQLNNQGNISLAEIENKAKNITKTVPKEEKEINQELRVIKAELAKLNEKFEDKLKDLSTKRTMYGTEEKSDRLEFLVSSKKEPLGSGRGRNQVNERLYSTLDANDKKRAASVDPEIYPSWWQNNSKEGRSRFSITPKPTEITIPPVDPRLNRNTVTRHHLDDSQAKQVMNQDVPREKVIRRNIHDARDYESNKSDRPYTSEFRANSESRTPTSDGLSRKPPLFSLNRPIELNEFEGTPTAEHNYDHRTRSPQFAQTKEDIMNNMLTNAQNNDKENIKQGAANTFGHKERSDKKNAKQKSNKKVQKQKQQIQPQHQNHHQPQSQYAQSSRRGNKNSHRDFGIKKKNVVTTSHTLDLKYVESKIKDEVEYHKRLARQQKTMAQNYNSYGGNSEYQSAASSSTNGHGTTNFELVVKEDPRAYRSNQLEDSTRVRPEQYYENSTLSESSGVGHNVMGRRSFLANYQTNQYPQRIISQLPSTNNLSVPEHVHMERNYLLSDRNQLVSERTDLSASKNSQNTQRGMLDIANNFLNSPLMQHLTIDGQNSNYSSKDFSQSNTMRKEISYARNQAMEKNSEDYQPSPFRRNELEDDPRQYETNHQHRYSDWGVNKPDTSKVTGSNSPLKESIDKRYSYYPYKESRILKRDDSSSLASSNFSNFLNEDMKGFYQKELGERIARKAAAKQGSGENSSNVSFNGIDTTQHNGEGLQHARKNTYFNFDNNKSYEAGNIFKQDMMSSTRNFDNN